MKGQVLAAKARSEAAPAIQPSVSSRSIRWLVLGPVAASADHAPLDLGPPLQRALLALLLAHAGEKVLLTHVLDFLWGPAPPATATNIVHRHVGALRRLVEPALPRRAQGSWLASDANGYRVVVDEHSLDLLEFRSLIAQARQATDPHQRMDLFESALGLWRGPVAQDVVAELGADSVIEAVNREQAAAAVEAAEDALALGATERILPALTLASRMNPTDELVHASLMRSLAGVGQRAAALETFSALRAYLSEELGVSPGPALQAAYLDVLHDRVETVRPVRALPTPRQLPARPSGFVGREAEVAELVAQLSDDSAEAAVSMVTGTAGVGKTSIAVHVAHAVADAFPAGQLYVDLRGFHTAGSALSPHDVLGRFLTALDIPPDRVPSDVDARADLYRSVAAGRRLLVVLDNARDTAQVGPLLSGAGSTRTIITSRQQLRGLASAGNPVLSLELFSSRTAEEFLRNRLSAARIDAEPEAVQQLIELAGNLPLALSLLAARAAHAARLPLADIVAAVRDRESTLDPFSDQSDPRTNLRAVLSWSYDSLSTRAARLFTLLAVHPGTSIAADQALAVAGLDASTGRPLIDELIEANVVSDVGGGRIWRHDLLRQYAAEQLEALTPAVRSDAERRLYGYVALSALTAGTAFSPSRQEPVGLPPWTPLSELGLNSTATAKSWLDAEYETVLALVTGARSEHRSDPRQWHQAWALDEYLEVRGLRSELIDLSSAGLQAAISAGDLHGQVVMHRGRARAMVSLARFKDAADEMRAAVRALNDQPQVDRAAVSDAYRYLAWALAENGDRVAGREAAQHAADVFPADSRDPRYGLALNALGCIEAELGLYELGFTHCMAAMDLVKDQPNPRTRANVWGSLGYLYAETGQTLPAVHAYRQSLMLFRAQGTHLIEAQAAIDLARVLRRAGRLGAARGLLEGTLPTLRELGHRWADEVADELTELAEIHHGDERA